MMLRERDILVNGPIEDPALAQAILFNAAGKVNNEKLVFPSNLLKDNSCLTTIQRSTNDPVFSGLLIASWRAVASLHSMAILEKQLWQHSQWELFQNIEMPLQICVADSEFGGIKIDNSKLSKLRQSIRDRQVVIEYYLKNIFGSGFNIDSPSDVAKAKAQIQQLMNKLNGTSEGSSPLMENNEQQIYPRSDWSAGKEYIARPHSKPLSDMNITDHPIMRVISEHRSHSRTIPLLTSTLGSRRFARVRPSYNTMGAETGRLILSHPPLQQVRSSFYIIC